MNNIVELENRPEAIKQLAAQAALYSGAKSLFSIQLFLSVPFIIIVAFAALALDKEWFAVTKVDISPYVGVLGIVLTLLDTMVFNPLISNRRSTAAKIQQCFDSTVLNLPWNEIVYGARPDQEIVEEWAKKNTRLVTSGKFDNWYRVEVRDLPHEAGRLVCQRANCWWDMQLRSRYNVTVGVVGVVLFATLVGISFGLDLTMSNFFSLVAAPFLPFVAIAPKLILDNRDAISRLQFMKDMVEETWNKALQPTYDVDALKSRSQAIQEGIYNNRSQNPLIFDWLANRLKPKNEDLQSKTTKQYVAEFKAAHPGLYP